MNKMEEFGKRIKALRQGLNMTQEELAQKTGYTSRSSINKIELGLVDIPQSKAVIIADALGVTPTYLLFGEDNKHSNIFISYKNDKEANASIRKHLEETTKKLWGIKIPVLGYVAAGIPISAIEDIIDYEEIPEQMLRDGSEYFALQIKGQSMEPRIYNGDVVIVRKQPDVDSGQIAIVCVNGDEATCKKIVKQESGILLQPLNPAYETVFYSAEQIENIPITILGRVVELRGKNF